MAASDNNNDVVTDFFPYYRLYKDGQVERFYELAGIHEVPPSLEDPATGVSSKDVSISAHVSARLYLPKNTAPNQKLPVLVYYHGGGLVIGSAFFKTEHSYLNYLVSESNCIAISVNYRLAPEHDIPTIYQDCWDALQWVASHSVSDTINKDPWIENHGDFNRVFVGGDSAGGNIVYNMIMRAGREKLIGDVKLLGAILSFPYLMIPSIENFDKGLSYKLWNIICPLSERGNDSPMVNPVSKKCPSLSTLGCSRLFVCTGEKDELVPGEVSTKFAEAVKKSGWKGEIESIVGVYYFRTHVLEDPAWEHTLELDSSSIRLKRNSANGGMFEIYGKDHLDYARALGYVHAKDRLVQMELQRLAGQGRLSEALKSDVGLLAVDTYFRSLNFGQDAREAVPKLAADAKAFLDAYCRGVNFYLEEHNNFWEQPLEFLMIQHRPEPWLPEHSLITAKLMAYVGLAETQGEIEKLMMQSIKGGVPMDALRAIFPTQLKNVETEVVDCIKEADVQIPTIPVEVKFAPYIPAFKASNNWVIGPQLTKSGSPLQCYDPHLDIARLPAIWYEFVFHYETPAKRYLVGVSVPGMPGIFFGRNNDVTFGVTYGFMDQIDFFFERVQNGKYLREVETTDEQGNKAVRQEWHEFQVRKEILKQKEGADVELVFYENDNGVIERKSYTGPLPDGLHLARKWAWREFEASDTSVLYPPPSDVKTVAEFHDIARNVPLSANWLNADRQGNIGYQQSGRLPARDPSVNSALPLLGWKASHRWNGSVDTNQLLQVINPAKGYLATANDDLQNLAPGAPKAINYHMGFYRVSRINELIENKGKDHLETPDNGKPTWDEEDMKRFQLDVYSKQGEYYMELLAPILKAKPNCTSCKTLLEWDRRFSTDSVGATVFTQFREALLDELFGENVFGKNVWMHLTRESGVMLVFQWYFDRVLLWDIFEREGIKNAFFDFAEDNAYIRYLWNEFLVDHEDATTGKPGREGKNAAAQARRSQLLERVVDEYLVPRNVTRERAYGSDHAMMMKNIFFDGTLPGSVALGLDVGPVPLAGSGSTVNQGSLFREQGREQSFCPSYRFITDLSQDWAYTAIPGAISGRRFSGLYMDFSFFRGLYKKVSAA